MGRRKRGWNVASSLSLNDLRRLIEAKEAETAQLADRRASLIAELDELDTRIAADGAGASRLNRKPGKRGPGRPRKVKAKRGRPAKASRGQRATGKRRGRKPGPKGKSELHGRIRSAMSGATEPMKATDIAKKVLDSGYKTKSKVFHLIVGQRLAEMKDVKKPERGKYALS